MANRRMISMDVVDRSPFVDCTIEARYLYYELNTHADDDGLYQINARTFSNYGVTDETLNELIEKGLVFDLGDNIIALIHWKLNNYVDPQKYHPTIYTNKRAMLDIDKEKKYFLKSDEASAPIAHNPYTPSAPTAHGSTPEYSIGEYSIGECNIDKSSTDKISIGEGSEGEVISPLNPPKGMGAHKQEKQDTIFIDTFKRYCNKFGIDNKTDIMLEYKALKEAAKDDSHKATDLMLKAMREGMRI